MQLFFKQIKKLLSKSKKKLIKKVTFPFLYWQFDILNDYLNQRKDIYFVQIGSNDGIVDDLLFEKINKFDYKGILIEPVPYLFNKLKENYKNKSENLIFKNIAIGNKRDKLPFYRLDHKNNTGLTLWYEGLGSFKKEVLLKHKSAIKDFDSLLITDSIELITFNDLIDKHNLKHINLLQIDTEGFEFEIILSIDFSLITIDVILYEHKHLTKLESKAVRSCLRENGYTVKKYNDFDSLAIKNGLNTSN